MDKILVGVKLAQIFNSYSTSPPNSWHTLWEPLLWSLIPELYSLISYFSYRHNH